LADVRKELNASNTVSDMQVMDEIYQVSQRIDELFKSAVPLFVPVIEARDIALNGVDINSALRTLIMRTTQGVVSPLLSLTGVGINTTNLVVGTNVRAYPPSPRPPYYQLQLLGSAWTSWYSLAYCADNAWGPQFASVTGVWGFNRNYAQAWLAVDALATAITATTATTFAVADMDGANAYGQTPRISAGNLVQIDSEWMDVVSTDTATNTVTVIRGVNGSTATTHLISAPVSVYQVDRSIRRATTRQVAAQYARQGAFNNVAMTGITNTDYPPDLMTEVTALLNLFANL
jgi:hypothetical protein